MRLPLFPLHTVLFPGETLPLHVFEPRYRQMMSDVASDPRFGVVAISAGTEVGAPSQTHAIGTVAVVERLAELPDGRIALECIGGQRFRIAARLPDDPYPVADVELLQEEVGADAPRALGAAATAIARYAVVVRRLGVAFEMPPPGSLIEMSFALAALLRLDLPLRQELLAADTAAERLRLISVHAKREATLLSSVGPSAGVPLGRPSPN